jgi:hypothetical protein
MKWRRPLTELLTRLLRPRPRDSSPLQPQEALELTIWEPIDMEGIGAPPGVGAGLTLRQGGAPRVAGERPRLTQTPVPESVPDVRQILLQIVPLWDEQRRGQYRPHHRGEWPHVSPDNSRCRPV